MQRGRTARADRRVGLCPAPDTMAILSGFLPVEQGVACLATLRTHTDSVKNTGDQRSRDQIMADTLVERITGQAAAADVQAEVAIVVPVDALVRPDAGSTAEVVGYGPIPAALAKDVLAGARGRRWWRRLFAAPHDGVTGGDPARRCFDGTLAALLGYRDGGRCREPFCDATRPPGRPHRSAPVRWAHDIHERPRHLRPVESGPRDARLAGPPRPRRPRRASAAPRRRSG